MSDLISRQAAIDAVETKIKKWNAVDGEGYHVGLGLRYTDVIDTLTELPSAQPEWDNHKVACLLAELYDDTCACNYNSIDEWLPEKCELLESCPHTVGVACWEQFLKHKAERRTDGGN